MITALRIIRLILKLLLFLILLPFLFLWLTVKIGVFQVILRSTLTNSGIPKNDVPELAKEFYPNRLWKQF